MVGWLVVGFCVGRWEGVAVVGPLVVGSCVGASDGVTVGTIVGERVGTEVVGTTGGVVDGCAVGDGVLGPWIWTVTLLLAIDSIPTMFAAVTI